MREKNNQPRKEKAPEARQRPGAKDNMNSYWSVSFSLALINRYYRAADTPEARR
jgi:hypothetical protein